MTQLTVDQQKELKNIEKEIKASLRKQDELRANQNSKHNRRIVYLNRTIVLLCGLYIRLAKKDETYATQYPNYFRLALYLDGDRAFNAIILGSMPLLANWDSSVEWVTDDYDDLGETTYKLALKAILTIRTKQDAFHAFSLLVQAGKQGSAEAQSVLGRMYLAGYGVEIDTTKAYDYFIKAAEKNVPTALYYLGVMYENAADNDLTENNELMLDYYQRANELGSSDAYYFLVMSGKIPDFESLQHASEAGKPSSQYILAMVHRAQGDVNNAFKWLCSSESKGDKLAKDDLTLMYTDEYRELIQSRKGRSSQLGLFQYDIPASTKIDSQLGLTNNG